MSSSSVTSTTLLTRNPDMVAANIDGDVVMMGIEQGQYYGITGVGPRVWELLATPVSIEEIAQVISNEYDTDPATCQSDMQTFVEELLKADLITVSEPVATPDQQDRAY